MMRDGSPPATAPMALTACLLVLLAIACIRATCSHDPFPGWSGDPFEVINPILGITPRVGLMLDIVALLAAGATLVLERARPLALGCLIVASASVLFHALAPSANRLEDAMLGFTWLSGLASAAAVMTSCRRPELRGLAMACLAGILPLLAFKGLHQYFVEHRETLDAFLADRERFLAAQGWAPGSPMALGYERRISQPEATGWFGLANVYATMGAASLVVGLGILVPAFIRPSSVSKRSGAVLLAVLGGAMLGASGAKGGYAAALVGALVLAGSAFARGRPATTRQRMLIAAALGLVCVLGPLVLVVARGLIGTASGELSILFRWYYLEGAATIIREHWVLGTGPAGFRDAYMLAKPPLAPEDVTSPHSVIFDHAACLGLGGIAAGAFFFSLVLGAARGCLLPATTGAGPDASLRTHLRLAAIPLIAAVMLGAVLEQPIQTPAMTVLRIMAMGCGILVAATVLSVTRHAISSLGVAFAAASLALASHAQIEMTLVNPGSVAWVLCLLGAAASSPETEEGFPTTPSLASRLTALSPVIAALVAATLLPRTLDWEHHLRAAYADAIPVAEFQSRAASMERSMAAREDSPAQLVNDLSAVLATPVSATSEGFAAGMTLLREHKAAACLAELDAAARAWPHHFSTDRVLARLLLARGLGPGPGSEDSRRAIDLARQGAERADTSVAWSWYATCLLAADPQGRRSEAVESLGRAAELAPREPSHAVRLARLLEPVDRSQSAAWAARALACDDNLRLDPLLRLPASEREAMQALASGR
ncbi:MAG: O-antigen ligase family protein [Phycisphaerae bacterium]